MIRANDDPRENFVFFSLGSIGDRFAFFEMQPADPTLLAEQ